MSEKLGLIDFYKFHSNGNAFIIIDESVEDVNLSQQQIIKICDFKRGLGADQLLILQKPINDYTDFEVKIFNADGSSTSQCVNGIRALAKYAFIVLGVERDFVIFHIGELVSRVYKRGKYLTTYFSKPTFEVADIPMKSGGITGNIYEIKGTDLSGASELTILSDKQAIRFFTLSVGNPHIISMGANVNNDEVFLHWGQFFQTSKYFPQKANFSLVQLIDSTKIVVRTFERGVGETESCGSAALASFIALNKLGMLEDKVIISNLKGEELLATREAQGYAISGQAKFICHGKFNSSLNLKTYFQDDFQDA